MADEPAKKRSFWVARWVTEEKFWRDITVQVIAGLLVVFIAFLVAVLTGYLRQPTVQHSTPHVLIFWSGVVVWVINIVLVLIYVVALRESHKPGNNWGRGYPWFLGVPMFLMGATPTFLWFVLAATGNPIGAK